MSCHRYKRNAACWVRALTYWWWGGGINGHQAGYRPIPPDPVSRSIRGEDSGLSTYVLWGVSQRTSTGWASCSRVAMFPTLPACRTRGTGSPGPAPPSPPGPSYRPEPRSVHLHAPSSGVRASQEQKGRRRAGVNRGSEKPEGSVEPARLASDPYLSGESDLRPALHLDICSGNYHDGLQPGGTMRYGGGCSPCPLGTWCHEPAGRQRGLDTFPLGMINSPRRRAMIHLLRAWD